MARTGYRTWLLPVFSLLSSVAARVYYRLTIGGEGVPPEGPVLLVANHPNSLLDPVLVAAAARRPVRFLAKAPLFSDPKVGWLVRGAGAIPVYRRVDDPSTTGHNVSMFQAAVHALSQGAAIGIFPEGASHSEPSLLELKTGAARIALGARADYGTIVPIVPVGLVFREKDVFRSPAAVVVGQAVLWEDLAPPSGDEPETVRTLTDRIEQALRRVTLNLDSWEDRPLIECAEAIWTAEWAAPQDRASHIARLEVTTNLLSELRRNPAAAGRELVRDVKAHCRRLERLNLRPQQLAVDVRLTAGFRWAIRRLYLLAIPALAIAVGAYVLFWVPYRLTGVMTAAANPPEDVRSTHKLFIGTVLYLLWTLILAVGAVAVAGVLFGLVALGAIPLIGLSGFLIVERWRGAWRDVRRFFLLRSRQALVQVLQESQHELAVRLKQLYDQRPESTSQP
jgi:1-acyl-sn-glycerol-3-phosphate acyltransferase